MSDTCYFVRTPIGFILLIMIQASLIIIIEIRNIIKELKKQNPVHQKGKQQYSWQKALTSFCWTINLSVLSRALSWIDITANFDGTHYCYDGNRSSHQKIFLKHEI